MPNSNTGTNLGNSLDSILDLIYEDNINPENLSKEDPTEPSICPPPNFTSENGEGND